MVSAEVCAFCLKALAAWTPPSQIDTSGSIVVKPIQLDVPTSILEAIPKAQADILAKAKDLCFDYHEFPQFGKARLKKLMIHPDAFVQVVIQAAVYMTHQRYGNKNIFSRKTISELIKKSNNRPSILVRNAGKFGIRFFRENMWWAAQTLLLANRAQ